MTVIEKIEYYVMLFDSVSYALKSEKILKKENIPFKLVPVPKSISSDCGVCIRFSPENKHLLISALEDQVIYREIRPL